MWRIRASGLVGFLIVVMHVGAAGAGGLYVNEYSTTSQANAGAGRGAWAPDASVTLHNPAAMTEIDEHALAAGFSLGVGRIQFDPDADSPSGARSGGNQAGIAPIASSSYVHRLSDRVRLGFTVFSLSGSILDPDNSWAGRFEVTELSLLTFSASPTVAVELTDWLSIGAGPVISYGVLDWDLRLALPAGPPGAEGQVRLDDFDDWEASGRVGLHLRPSETLQVSAYYQSETEFSLSGKLNLPAGISGDADIDLPLAQFVEVAAAWQATERLMLLATFNWEDWSTMDEVRVGLPTGNVDVGLGFQDTFKVGLGANYRLAERWLLQTGLMFDSSALNNNDRTTALPVDQQIRAAIGFQHRLSDGLTAGASFVYWNLGQGEVRNPTVRGDYEENDLFILGFTLSFDTLPWAGRLELR